MAGSADGIWESTFAANELLWGLEPSNSAVFAADRFARAGARSVLIPGIGYGRNARPFLDRGMSVTGIEISETAIAMSRSELGLDIAIHRGSVEDMPYDGETYDGIFSYALLHLLDAPGRAKLIGDCALQLAPGGHMVFSVVRKTAPMYGRGKHLGEDWYEVAPGVPMYFYDAASLQRELGGYGLLETSEIDEAAGGGTLPFHIAICRKP